MSAFGRRPGATGSTSSSRPSFGVAKPMKSTVPLGAEGGSQFPPIESLSGAEEELSMVVGRGDAMARLDERMAQSGEQSRSKNEGFEASIARTKEQVPPRRPGRAGPA